MKRFRLLAAIFIVALGIGNAMAQYRHSKDYRPTVYAVAIEQTNGQPCTMQELIVQKNIAANNAREDFFETQRTGYHQVHNPQFIFATKDNRFALGIGGYINLRTSYDFKGAVDDIDFVPYDIPVGDNYAFRQRVMMDATTSRLFTKAVVNSQTLGRVVAFVDMDFRGGEEFSYTPRLRSAYVSMFGITAGRDATTFCDLNAVPHMVDFEGPNAYNFNFATMLRYEMDFLDNHMRFGVAAEMPKVSGSYGEYFMPVAQRVPDFPVYLQYSWGAERQSHFRASAIFRNMYMHNALREQNTSLFGWGVQASGSIDFFDMVTLRFNGIYGKGITPYIQDLNNSGLDFVPNPENPEHVETMPMWAWQASAQIDLMPHKFWVTGGYSSVHVEQPTGMAADSYKRGSYIFGNVFYNVTSDFTIALEYLHGARKNFDNKLGGANRLSLMLQYNF